MPSRTRRFFLNALSITSVSLLMRSVGVAFNIYVSNIAGAEAMGLYSLLGGIYGFSITIAAAGINLGTTRLVSESLGKDDTHTALSTVKCALICCSISGGCASILLFGLSDIIGKYILSDERTIASLRVLSFTLIPVAVCSCLSGYFNAVRRVKISSASQVLIQGIKIFVTSHLLSMMLYNGTEQACLSLVLGGAFAEIVSLIISFSLYVYDRNHHFPTKDFKKTDNPGLIAGKLLKITIPITVASCIRSGLTTIQHVLIPKGLKLNGASWQAALSSYGILHSMVLPVILFPSAFITSFSGLLIPEVAECKVRGDYSRLRRITYRILTLSLFFSIGVSGIMIFLSNDIGMTFYNSKEACIYIRTLAPLIPIMYIDSAVDAILKGMGHQIYSMNVNIIDALTSCIFALLLIPRLGIYGYIISIYATECMNTILSIIKMMSITKAKFKPIHQIVLPCVCIIGSTLISKFILTQTHHPFNSYIELFIHVTMASLIYFIFLLITRAIGNDETEVFRASLLSEKTYAKYVSEIYSNNNKPNKKDV